MNSNAIVADGSGKMFDQIAGRYDLLNRILSMGMDRGWRRDLVRALDPDDGEVLDVATGTADVALSVAKKYPQAQVIGLDPSGGMLDVGRQKVDAAGLNSRVELIQGDAQAMPFDDNRFAASCIAFGIRNVPDRRLGLAEMIRCTRPGGAIAVLELGEPHKASLHLSLGFMCIMLFLGLAPCSVAPKSIATYKRRSPLFLRAMSSLK